jgi:hypothetical protein
VRGGKLLGKSRVEGFIESPFAIDKEGNIKSGTRK